MTREEADFIGGMNMCDEISNEAYKKIMCHCEEQEPCEDCISRLIVQEEISKSIALKENSHQMYKRIQAIPPVTPQPFINKPCVSEGVCREDKIQVLDKIRAEIKNSRDVQRVPYDDDCYSFLNGMDRCLEIIDKYKAESEVEE